MTVFRAESLSTSRHPQDWGRALALALEDLIMQSNEAHADACNLFGVDVLLRIEETSDGARLVLSWIQPDEDPEADR